MPSSAVQLQLCLASQRADWRRAVSHQNKNNCLTSAIWTCTCHHLIWKLWFDRCKMYTVPKNHKDRRWPASCPRKNNCLTSELNHDMRTPSPNLETVVWPLQNIHCLAINCTTVIFTLLVDTSSGNKDKVRMHMILILPRIQLMEWKGTQVGGQKFTFNYRAHFQFLITSRVINSSHKEVSSGCADKARNSLCNVLSCTHSSRPRSSGQAKAWISRSL